MLLWSLGLTWWGTSHSIITLSNCHSFHVHLKSMKNTQQTIISVGSSTFTCGIQHLQRRDNVSLSLSLSLSLSFRLEFWLLVNRIPEWQLTRRRREKEREREFLAFNLSKPYCLLIPRSPFLSPWVWHENTTLRWRDLNDSSAKERIGPLNDPFA